MRAAILTEFNQPLVIDEVEIAEPRRGEALVRIGATGICHSDLHLIKGEWPRPLPLVPGHEAAGTIEALGPDTGEFAVGDRVICVFRPNCRRCFYCTMGHPVLCEGSPSPWGTYADGTTRLTWRGEPLIVMGRMGSFAEYAIVPVEQLVPLHPDLPIDQAALVGCAVMTGVGAVINTAQVQAGSSVAVIGCGGVGLNVIQAAAIVGASKVIAIDISEEKLAFARQMGATHTINSREQDVVAAVKELTAGRGADYTFEVVGRGATIRQAVDACRPRGTVTVVGAAPADEEVRLNALQMVLTERIIRGSWYGSPRPRIDMPRIVELVLNGKLRIAPLIRQHYRLDQINEGFEALQRGEVARGVVVF